MRLTLVVTFALVAGCAGSDSGGSPSGGSRLLAPAAGGFGSGPRGANAAGSNAVSAERPAAPSDASGTVPPPLPDPGSADLDPDNDAVVAPPASIPDCEERLTRAGIAFDAAELRRKKLPNGVECGAPEVVVYGGPKDGAVRWNAKPIVSCGMALALGRFEAVLAEVADRELGSRVVKIEQGGTYNCRKMARFDMVSEHSYANAIDVRSFRLADGRTVSVARHFGRPGTEPRTKEGRFLRALARRLYDDGVFSAVITEYFDRLHRDHFHFDLARYRIDGTR